VGDGFEVRRDLCAVAGGKSPVAVWPRLWQLWEVARWVGVVAFEPYGLDCGCCLLRYEQAMFEQDGEVDEIADSRVLTFPEVTEHAVELLCRMPVDVDCFDVDGRDARESQRAGYGELVGGMEFMSPGGHVELDASERLVGQLCADFGAPGGESAVVIA